MGKKVICCITAFDCEKTIAAAMESVLNQSYDNWLCFVLSNGNQDTPEAPNASFSEIKNFAGRDRRFIVVNKRTNDLGMYFFMLCHMASRFPGSYICALDADDEYEPDFFARSAALAETHNLDIVACGTQIILKRQAGETEGTLLSRRQLETDLIVRGTDFTSLFPAYKPFFNEMWGKLYRTSLFPKPPFKQYLDKKFGKCFLPDTMFAVDLLSKSRAIGVLSGTCHKFFQYQHRPSTNATLLVNAARASGQAKRRKDSFSIYKTYETVMLFLKAHGTVDKPLYEYLQAVLFGWLGDYYSRTLLPVQDEAIFASLAEQLIFHPKFDELMRYRGSGKYDNLRDYRQRLEFCAQLRYTLLGQQAVQNRKALWRDNLLCTRETRRKLDRLIDKLEDTIQTMLKLREEPAT